MSVNILQKVSKTAPVGQDGLPEGWELVTLPDVANINPPKPSADALPLDAPITFVPMPAVDADQGVITKPESRPFGKVRKGYTSFREGDVIMAKITPCMENGKAAIARGLQNGFGFGSTEFHVFRSNGAISADFLYHFIRRESFRKTAEHEMTGSVGQKRVPLSFLESVEIPLPPLAEQKRIVAKIEQLLARVNATRARLVKVPAILKRFRQTVLAAACSGRLTEDWRNIHGVDAEWRTISLEEVAAEFSYGSSAKSSPSGTMPVLRMGNIQDGRLDWDNLVFTSDPEEIEKYRLLPGDVLFNRTNSPELVGKTAVYKGERPAIYAGYLIRVRCGEDLLPDYLNYCLNSPMGRDFCWRVKTDAVSQSNINAKKLAAFEFQLPAIEEQTEIARRVETLFRLADTIEKRIAAGARMAERD